MPTGTLAFMYAAVSAVEGNVGKTQDGGACLLHFEAFGEVYKVEIS